MKKIFLIPLLLIILLHTVNAQAADDPEYKLNPTLDKESPMGVYIPKNLEECFTELKSMLHASVINDMASRPEKEMIRYHRGLGMWIRNNWGLWSNSRLKEYFNNLGIFHPDDMSGIILDSFWRHLNNRAIGLEEQIKFYQEYWERVKKQKEK